jgi:hypothetical protein
MYREQLCNVMGEKSLEVKLASSAHGLKRQEKEKGPL